MKNANRLPKRAAYAVATAVATAGVAAIVGAASTGFATSASAAPGGRGAAATAAASSGTVEAAPVTRTVTLHLGLSPMPQGQLVLGTGGIRLAGYGFTPGSSHAVAASFLGLEVPVGTLTANAVGSVNWSAPRSTVTGALARHGVRMDASGATSASVRLVILNAGRGTPAIAQTLAITGFGRYPVHAGEPGRGVIKPGRATIVYNPAAKTISVTVNATGFTPGAHAAHIHVGSCQRQGPIAHMLTDFTANSHGAISNETRTVRGVTTVKLSGGWYLNLHQGNSGNIASNGQPTIYFRPLDCANI